MTACFLPARHRPVSRAASGRSWGSLALGSQHSSVSPSQLRAGSTTRSYRTSWRCRRPQSGPRLSSWSSTGPCSVSQRLVPYKPRSGGGRVQGSAHSPHGRYSASGSLCWAEARAVGWTGEGVIPNPSCGMREEQVYVWSPDMGQVERTVLFGALLFLASCDHACGPNPSWGSVSCVCLYACLLRPVSSPMEGSPLSL